VLGRRENAQAPDCGAAGELTVCKIRHGIAFVAAEVVILVWLVGERAFQCLAAGWIAR
jgi:hypothetical protein